MDECKSVAAFINALQEDVYKQKHNLFGKCFARYLLFLSKNVELNVVKKYCERTAVKMLDYAKCRSMDENRINQWRRQIEEILKSKWNQEKIEKISQCLSQIVLEDERIKKIDLDFIDSRFLKIPKLVEVVYRGHACSDWKLQPSIFREPGRMAKYERDVYYEMMMRAPDMFKEDNAFENLVLMQHYFCPTRLLDVTLNPLVALYFACIDKKEQDGEIFIFVNTRFDFWDDISVQAQSKVVHLDYGRKKDFWNDVVSGKPLDKYNDVFTPEELDPVNFLFPIWARTKNIAPRIERQSGAFVIIPEIGSQEDGSGPLNSFCCKTYIIPKDYKDDILRELDTVNVNDAALFDGLEHVGHYLKTVYE